MKVVWRVIPGFTHYLVSTNGEIKSMPRSCGKRTRKYERIIKPFKTKHGYISARICENTVTKTLLVHRAVALAFLPNPHNKPQVNHKNGIKTDNRIKNLEWATASENMIHAVRTGLQPKSTIKRGAKTPQCKAVVKFSMSGEYISEYHSVTYASMEMGVGSNTIVGCCRGTKRSAKGHLWLFKEEYDKGKRVIPNPRIKNFSTSRILKPYSGECPICNNHYQQLQRHYARMHPTLKAKRNFPQKKGKRCGSNTTI